MGNYYEDENFLNVSYAMKIALETHFANMLFGGDSTRVIYSSNAYAFRKRSKSNDGNLALPFLNFKIVDYSAGKREWWHANAYTTGMYLSDLEEKVQFAPVQIDFEATYWCHRADEMFYAASELIWDADNKTVVVAASIDVDGTTVDLAGALSYAGPKIDPTYDENDWLERNKIHNISLDFDVNTFHLKTNSSITIPTTVAFEWARSNTDVDDEDTFSYEETISLIIDHLSEEVTEA
jgi:hypothetical protein